ncbi:DUF6428 family protein [Lentiprolixibacter aurantiacus]|uniref:DUF6428 family protein n=1 Tax=Lentiprolixibacter aurantiacus TaxID=2993939 RepID=A0AAE3SN02_9FLAO|nr:DUF6428 family protein [Lentiprolixibacter aurantiacus]MCX2718846.1 DUF6428 family protein [Lentiprolixibacter aurantiacus]
MKTREFIELLEQNPGKSLLFEYRHGETVAPNYHITEIKNVSVDTVDCGAGTDFWKETVIQLWESPVEKESRSYMSAFKAMSIINRVDKIKPLQQDAILKFEYGNANFHTAQLPVMGVDIETQQLRVKLAPDITDCKAKSECGIPEEVLSTPATKCAPGSGCC